MSTQQNRQIRELVDGLSQRPDRPMPTLRPEEPRGGIPSRRGYVERQYQPGSDGGETTAGIASPLTEGSQTPGAPQLARAYHQPQTVTSTDGIFVWEVEAIATMQMFDANGSEALFHFADPRGSGP